MNAFDQQFTRADVSGLGDLGFNPLKELKNAAKSVTKRVGKPIAKVLPKPLVQLGSRLDDAGITKVAAGAALLTLGMPFLSQSVGAIASKGASIAVKGAGMVKSGVGAVGAALASGGKASAQVLPESIKVFSSDAIFNARNAQNLMRELGSTPQMQSAINQLLSQGYSPDAVVAELANSNLYRDFAIPQIAQTVHPQIYAAASQVAPQPIAQSYADRKSLDVAAQAVESVKMDQNLIPLIVGLGLAALIGA